MIYMNSIFSIRLMCQCAENVSHFVSKLVFPETENKFVVTVVKQLKKKAQEAKIDMNKTIFREWKPPTEKDFDSMLEHDIKHWKIPRFIKDPAMVSPINTVENSTTARWCAAKTTLSLTAVPTYIGLVYKHVDDRYLKKPDLKLAPAALFGEAAREFEYI